MYVYKIWSLYVKSLHMYVIVLWSYLTTLSSLFIDSFLYKSYIYLTNTHLHAHTHSRAYTHTYTGTSTHWIWQIDNVQWLSLFFLISFLSFHFLFFPFRVLHTSRHYIVIFIFVHVHGNSFLYKYIFLTGKKTWAISLSK